MMGRFFLTSILSVIFNTNWSRVCFLITGLQRRGQLTTLEEVLKGRNDFDTMSYLCDNIVPCVVGKKEYTSKISSEKIETWLTVSSEALALLLYENLFKNAKSIGHMMNNNSELTLGEAGLSADPAKWTRHGKGARRNEGWDDNGIERYVELYKFVKGDREKNKDFSQLYLDKKKAEDEAKKGKKRKAAALRKEQEDSRTKTTVEDDDWAVDGITPGVTEVSVSTSVSVRSIPSDLSEQSGNHQQNGEF